MKKQFTSLLTKGARGWGILSIFIIIFTFVFVGGLAHADSTSTSTTTDSIALKTAKLQQVSATVASIKTSVDQARTQIHGLIEQSISDAIKKIVSQNPPTHGLAEHLNAVVEAPRQALLKNVDDGLSGFATMTPARIKSLSGVISSGLKNIQKSLDADPASNVSGSNQAGVNNQDLALAGINLLNHEQDINAVLDSLANTVESQYKELGDQQGSLLFKDSNGDGISDYEKIFVYGIDPNKQSPTTLYEGKKITAGEKVLLGFDPTQAGLVKINPEDVKVSTAPVSQAYKVSAVALNTEKKIVLNGQALPNGFVTLYIYSTPIVVTVKANADGEWQYILDKELENGNHTVYTAAVNNTGKILAKGNVFAFAKTADAATESALPPDNISTDVSRPGVFSNNNLLIVLSIVAVLVIIALLIMGITSRNQKENK